MGYIIWTIWIRYHVMLSNLHVPFSYIFWFLYEIKLEWVLSFGWVEELNKWKSQYVSSQNLSMGKDTIWNIYTIYYIIIYISPSISTLMQLNNSQNGIITTLKPTNSFIFTFSLQKFATYPFMGWGEIRVKLRVIVSMKFICQNKIGWKNRSQFTPPSNRMI